MPRAMLFLIMMTGVAWADLPGKGTGAFVRSCGNARPDLLVCLQWNRKAERGTLDLDFPRDGRDVVDVVHERGERAGIDWYFGAGVVRGTRLLLWLRVDDGGALLPVTPRPPRTAALFYRYGPNQKWTPYPSSTQFLFTDLSAR